MTSALVVEGSPPADIDLAADLAAAGVRVLGAAPRGDLVREAARTSPDVVVCHEVSPDETLFAAFALLAETAPCPVVVFTHDPEAAKIERALAAGIHAYVVNGYSARAAARRPPGRALALRARAPRPRRARRSDAPLRRTKARRSRQGNPDAGAPGLGGRSLRRPARRLDAQQPARRPGLAPGDRGGALRRRRQPRRQAAHALAAAGQGMRAARPRPRRRRARRPGRRRDAADRRQHRRAREERVEADLRRPARRGRRGVGRAAGARRARARCRRVWPRSTPPPSGCCCRRKSSPAASRPPAW